MFAVIVALTAWASPTDEAIEALVQGRESTALKILRSATRDDESGRIRCLLGEVALQTGRPQEAIEVLDALPEDARCAGRAAFLRAEAARALGRVDEAAQRYGDLTRTLLHPVSQPLGNRLEAWADQVLETPDNEDWAAQLLLLAATLEEEGERRVELARRIATLRPSAGAADFAIEALTASIVADPSRTDDRLLLAPLLPSSSGLTLLEPLADTPRVQAVRARIAPDLATRHQLAAELLRPHPDSDEARVARLDVGRALALAGWTVEAGDFLEPLGTEDALWALSTLAVRQGASDASHRLETFLKRFPTSTHRASAEARLQQLRLAALRTADTFDAAAWDAIATTPELALEAAWASGAPDDRLDELIARWPRSASAREALRHRALQEGADWLRTHPSPAADAVRTELSEPEIGIRTLDAGRAEVELQVRGASTLDLRLHRIDLEGWLRAGGRPGSLGDLDVAVVSPDHTWTLDVPQGSLQSTFTTPVPVDGPGLYAVTASTTDREARTLLLVSDVQLVTRTQGPDLALAAFRDGKPVPRARFLVRSDGALAEVVADGDGLARVTRSPSGPAVVVAQTRGGPAVVEVGESFTPETHPVDVAIDLDRPVYRPGDVVRFRAVATSGGTPVTGAWRVSLTSGSITHQVVRLASSRDGTVHGEVVVPWVAAPRRAGGAGGRTLALRVLPPNHDAPIDLANVAVVESVPLAHDVSFAADGDSLAVKVVDGLGVPVADLPLRVDEGLRKTDATGRLLLSRPPEGLPWTVDVQIPADEARHRYVRPAPRVPHQAVALVRPRSAPNDPIEVTLEGESSAILRVVRLSDAVQAPPPRTGPPPFEVPSLQVFERHTPRPVPSGLRTTHSEHPVEMEQGSITLPGLPEGWYRLELVAPDGSRRTVGTTLEVRPGARVRLDGTPTVGETSQVRVDGGWALVTAEGGRMLAARLVPPGGSRTLEVDRRWHGEVSLVATTPTDQDIRTVTVDAALDVDVQAALTEGRWRVSGQVRDAAGNPVRAEVVVRAVDRGLVDEMGPPTTLSASLLVSPVSWTAQAARAFRLTHGGWAVPLSPALMAESARAAEARRRELASQGRLSESLMSGVLGDDVVLEQGFGGLGSRGSGVGGGGYGTAGRSGLGSGSGRGRMGHSPGLALRGVRTVGLWKVVQTDKDGRWSVAAPAPAERATWRVEAIAVAPGSFGRAQTLVEPAPTPFLVVDELAPGQPGDRARPRVYVVNPGTATTARLEVDGRAVPLAIDAGGVGVHALELSVGQSATLRLGDTERVVSFPAASPTRIVSPRLAASVGLAADPAVSTDPGRAAVAGRAALAALPALDRAEREVAEQRIRAAVGAVREGIGGLRPRYAAQGLLLVAEATTALQLPAEVVSEVAEQITVEPGSPQERLELAWARAVAGLPPAEATLGRLNRDVDRLDAEGRALLVRLMLTLERQQPNVDLGAGAQGVLASRLSPRDRLPPVSSGLPPVGAPERPDWIRAALPGLADLESVTTEQRPEPTLHTVWGARRPGGLAGRPLPVAHPTSAVDERVRCGTEELPCAIGVGDVLALSRTERAWQPTGGLRWSVDGRQVVAATRGDFTLHGLGRPVHVRVGDPQSPLGQGERLALARLRHAVDASAADLLNDRPSLEDWEPRHRAEAAQVRFAETRPDDGAAWIAAFEDLRDQVPNTPIALDDVVATADAYRAIGRPERAIQVYERAIGQLFLKEAGVLSPIEGIVGPLAAIKTLRRIGARYPAVPLVEQATFALPDRLLELVDAIPAKAAERGVTPTELRLMAAAWDREFVALAPDSPLAPEAGLRLATGLLELGAERRTLDWAVRLQRRHPDNAMLDRWLLLEALVRTELGETARAESVLRRLSSAELPLGGGRRGPSALRDDARFALGRLAEAERNWSGALSWYGQVEGSFPEASLAAHALSEVSLATSEPFVRGPVRDRSTLSVTATNVDTVEVRAYAIDLRTLFLRESGLPRPEDVQVDGLRPDVSVSRSIEAGPFPVERTVDLPLTGPGAWLVRLDADGASSVVWVLRSDLELHAVDAQGIRRLVARQAGTPTAEVAVRAVGRATIVAAETDIRGVALLGAGAPALGQWGAHYALTADARPRSTVRQNPGSGVPMPTAPSLLDRVKSREEERRSKSRQRYDFIGEEAQETIDANKF